MNRIDSKFKELKAEGRKAFIAYLTVGFPDLKTNFKLILEMEKRGVDMVELGVPFSDPIADGPTIQSSSQASLENGTALAQAFELAVQVRKNSSLPLILMGYLNPFLKLPAELLARKIKQAGIDGVIIPDLPPEEAGFLRIPLNNQGICTIFLLTPNSPPERVKLVARLSSGFIYYVSYTGVTGKHYRPTAELRAKVGEIKKITSKPVCVGFGISARRHLEGVWKIADGAIVGSALIKPFLETSTTRAGFKKTLKKLDDLLPKASRR